MKRCLDYGDGVQGEHSRISDLWDDTQFAMKVVLTVSHTWLLKLHFNSSAHATP
jgi:hypothetical protein